MGQNYFLFMIKDFGFMHRPAILTKAVFIPYDKEEITLRPAANF